MGGLDSRWNKTDFVMRFGAKDGGINNGEFMYLVGDWAAGYIQGGTADALCQLVNDELWNQGSIEAFIQDCASQGLTVDGYDSRGQLNDTTPHSDKAGRQWIW